MVEYKEEEDTKINVLANVDSYFGTSQSRIGPILLYIGVIAIPVMLYVFLFISILPLWVLIVFEALFAARMALLILLDEKGKMKVYMASRQDEYANADDIIRVSNIQDDGMVEYENGTIMYILSAFTTTYLSEDALAEDLERFLKLLIDFNFDMHINLVVDEYRLQDSLENLQVYEDKELMKERVDMYVHFDKECSENSMLYRIDIPVRASRYDWKRLRKTLENATSSSIAKCFKQCFVCNKDQVEDVLSRDIFAFVNVTEMMQKKHNSEEYQGSKVYFYGEEEITVSEEDMANLEERRSVERNN